MASFSNYQCSKLGMPRWCGGVHQTLCHNSSSSVSLANFDIEELMPSQSECEAYELYIHLSELSCHWNTRLWPEWQNEEIVRVALQSMELSFRMISFVLCDVRPYVDKEEWLRRLEHLVASQLEVIGLISEGDRQAPTASAQEAWQRPGSQVMLSKMSQESLLPRLSSCSRAQDVISRIRLAIECQMLRVSFTLGLGEPNLSQKPFLEYDKICRPSETHECKHQTLGNPEDHTLFTIHQILECWLFAAHRLLKQVEQSIDDSNLASAAKICWVVERVWQIIAYAMDLLLLMDPDDFMKLKHELAIHTGVQAGTGLKTEGGAYCLRSNMLKSVTNACKELRHLVPKLVGVQADPKGGPRLQEAVMEMLHTHGLRPAHEEKSASSDGNYSHGIHVLQAFQAIEMSVRKFFFSYQQLVICVMGSGEFKGTYHHEISAADAISHIYFEPPYFPSLDGAKTFLGAYWHYHHSVEEGSKIKLLLNNRSSKASSGNWSSSVSNSCCCCSSDQSMSQDSSASE